jgi:glycosyltransferase involved in cell wall biosynthesis
LHGIETIIQAAAELQSYSNIRFDFYGEGQERPRAEQLVRELGLNNVRFHGWIDKEALPGEIARSHISLGVFGTTTQSRYTIQNKIWESMFMNRAVITGDSVTIRRAMTHRENIYLVQRANPKALVSGILELESDSSLRERIASAGNERAQENTIAAIGRLTRDALLTIYRQ